MGFEKAQNKIKVKDHRLGPGKVGKLPIDKYLHKLALIEKEFKKNGPSEALFARADSLNKISPIRSYIDIKRYLGK